MVYIIRKAFYDDNGIDRAIALGLGDITCFSTWKKAEEYILDLISTYEKNGKTKYFSYMEDPKTVFADDVVKKAKTYVQGKYEDGVRFGYTLVQPIVY